MSIEQSKKNLQVIILSPEKTLYEGLAKSITCMNKEGEFDILPLHSNFISLIYKKIIIHQNTGNDIAIEMGYALLKCVNNQITILTNVDISTYSDILNTPH